MFKPAMLDSIPILDTSEDNIPPELLSSLMSTEALRSYLGLTTRMNSSPNRQQQTTLHKNHFHLRLQAFQKSDIDTVLSLAIAAFSYSLISIVADLFEDEHG
jgi:hypothetical protein